MSEIKSVDALIDYLEKEMMSAKAYAKSCYDLEGKAESDGEATGYSRAIFAAKKLKFNMEKTDE